MGTKTFIQSLSPDSWVQIGDGTNTEVGAQLAGPASAALFIGASTPSAGETAYMVLSVDGDRSAKIALTSGDVVYARGLNENAVVRGYVS